MEQLALSGLAIVVIGILEGLAVSKGINGKGLAIAIGAIAGIAGFNIRGILGGG